MVRINENLEHSTEDMLAELTTAAYRVALRHGLRGAFNDVELELWRELRKVLRRELRQAGAEAW